MFNPFIEILLDKEINNIKKEEENQNNQNITQDNKDNQENKDQNNKVKQDNITNTAENKDQENKDKVQNDNKESGFEIINTEIPENILPKELKEKVVELFVNYLKELYKDTNYEEVKNVQINLVNGMPNNNNEKQRFNNVDIAMIKANLKLPKSLAKFDNITIYLNGDLNNASNISFDYFKQQLEKANQPKFSIDLTKFNNNDNQNNDTKEINNNQKNNTDNYKLTDSILERLQALNDTRNKEIEITIKITDESGKVQAEKTTLISRYPQEVIDKNFESLEIVIMANNEILGSLISGNINYKLIAKEINNRIKESNEVLIRSSEIPKKSKTQDAIEKIIAGILVIGLLIMFGPKILSFITDIVPLIGIALVIGGLVVYYFKRKSFFSDTNNNTNNYKNNYRNNENNRSYNEQFDKFIKKTEKFITLENTMQLFTPELIDINNIKTENLTVDLKTMLASLAKSVNHDYTTFKQFLTAYAKYKIVKDPAQYTQYLHAANNLPHIIGLGALTVVILYLAGIAASMYSGASFSHVIAPLSILALSGFASLYAYFAQMQHLPLNSSKTIHMFISTAKSNISSIIHISPIFAIIAAILTGAIVFKVLSFISAKLQNPPKANPSVLSESNLNNNLNAIRKQVL